MNWLLQKVKSWFRDGWSISVDKEITWTGYTKHMEYTPQTFLEAIRPHALVVEAQTKIPWVFMATQAAHESRYGNSRLTKEANNLFGITGDSWYTQGKPVYWIETTEFNKEGIPFKIRRPFRKYDNWAASLQDWASLIERRYPAAYHAAMAGNFPLFAAGLQKGGYATDPRYATQLVALHRSIALSAPDTPPESPEKGPGGDSTVA